MLGYLDDHPACVAAHATGSWVTTHAHLLEIYSVLRSRPEVADPDEVLRILLPLAIPIPHAAVKPAAEIRQKLRAQGKDCSYIDALGYGVSQALGIPLLIADESFEGVSGVTRIAIAPGKRAKAGRPGRS